MKKYLVILIIAFCSCEGDTERAQARLKKEDEEFQHVADSIKKKMDKYFDSIKAAHQADVKKHPQS